MSTQVIERDKLGVLTKIGQGGQGAVYQAPNAKTKFASSMVYKEYKPQVRSEIDFTALAAMPALVEESLSYVEAERLIGMAAWPCRIVENAGTPSGFVMPAIPERFVIALTTAKGATPTTAEFQHLLNHPSVLAARGIDIDDVQRCALLREVASGLAFLHNHGVCVGDISPKNLLFCLTAPECVYFIDCDAIRINGVTALPQVETPGWETPAGEELATIYSDAYKLGLLALRLLAGDQDTKNPQHLPASTPALLRQIITDTLTNDPHTRPLPEAWTYVLGHAIEETQHHKLTTPTTPPPTSNPPTPPPTPTARSRPPANDTSAPPPYSTPPVALSAPPPSRPGLSPSTVWAGVAVLALVIIAVVVTVKLTNHNNTPSTAPTTSYAASASNYPSAPATSTYTTPATYSTTVPPSAVASADVPGLAPFAGSWHAHEEGLDIQPNGHGRETYNDRSTCPDAPMAGCGIGGTTDFMLTSVSGDTATGTITAASNPKNPIGGPVTIKLVGGGQGLELTIAGGDQGFEFCNNNDNDAAMHYYCGA